jgi:cyclopropane-fatty-acyl-phospholipid synthase
MARYLAAFEQVQALRGSGFARAWHLYLAGSVAAFTTGSMQLFQVVFARARNNQLPPSRRHLYS